MGTRADFYVGRGAKAQWLGSIGWDGYPKGIPAWVRRAPDELRYRLKVSDFLNGREDKTLPEDGWPWPWEDSSTTDYAYAFDEGKVWASSFGGDWFPVWNLRKREPDSEGAALVFPNMKDAKQREKFGPHSGIIIIGGGT